MKIKVIAKKDGKYHVKVVAANGEPLVWSEVYASKESAMHCVELLKTEIAMAELVEVQEE